ncbi:MAG: CoA transferase [Flavobacteriales bacterium]|nr:CoA transferase [Flavobacteriales bacterium]
MSQPNIRQVFASIPDRFRKEKAEGYRAVLHFDLGEIQQTVTIADGRCIVVDGLVDRPTCVVHAKAETYLSLELGELNPQMALMTGKVKVSDLSEMMRFAKCFRKFGTEKLLESAERPGPIGPLSGYRILDLTKLLPGPLATLWLAQQGAEVLKVEDPSSPDPIRDYPPIKNGLSVYHEALNAGKRSLALDYRKSEGRELLLKLVGNSDVVIEQFRPGVMEAFGLGYETLRKANPGIILASITGYGRTGPMAGLPGHDINYLSYSGLLDGLRDADGNPVIPTAQLADVAGGSMMALNAITTALLHRERTGMGQHVDVAMTKALPHFHALRWAEGSATNNYEGHLSGKMASYNIYRCADGRHVALGALEPKFWKKFCQLANRPDWENRILDADQTTLKNEVSALFASHPMQHWTEAMEHDEVCLSPVLTLREAAAHPLFAQGPFPPPMGNSPSWPAPQLGADNAHLLRELGLSDQERSQLRERGVTG